MELHAEHDGVHMGTSRQLNEYESFGTTTSDRAHRLLIYDHERGWCTLQTADVTALSN